MCPIPAVFYFAIFYLYTGRGEYVFMTTRFRRRPRKYSPYHRWAVLQFVMPFLVLYLLFKIWPIVYAFALSFHSWRGLGPWNFVGLANYLAFFRDPRVVQAISNTLIMGAGELVITVLFGFSLAILLDNRDLPGKTIFRVIYFMPRVVALAVAAIAFSAILQRDYGVLNWILGHVGIDPIPWLQRPGWARFSVVIARSWVMVGFVMIYFTAGLQAIPDDLYEAARIDGASSLQTLFKITVPLLRRVVVFVMIISTVQAFQIFAIPYLMTAGGPSRATTTVIMLMIDRGISAGNYGLASAITVVLATFLGVVASFQFRIGGSDAE